MDNFYAVDIDVVYVPRQIARDEALEDINRELGAVADRLGRLGLDVRFTAAISDQPRAR